MTLPLFALVILVFSGIAFTIQRGRAAAMAGNIRADASASHLNSLPRHHGYVAACCFAVPGLFFLVFALVSGPGFAENLVLAKAPKTLIPSDPSQRELFLSLIRLAETGELLIDIDPTVLSIAERLREQKSLVNWAFLNISILIGCGAFLAVFNRLRPDFRARAFFEKLLLSFLLASALIATLTTVGIFLSLIRESARFFLEVPVLDFVLGDQWSPQTPLREDQVAASGAFGALPLFAGTLLISFVAILVAGPIGLLAAVYLTQYADRRVRETVKPTLEILAGVPTVVYGFFAALVVAPFFHGLGQSFGIPVDAESALAAGVVMGIMIIPFVSSLSHDALMSVPASLTDGSLALGATKSETIIRVIIPAASHGIISAFLLAISRAVGETMIVVMAAGLRPNLTANPLEAVTTVTAQILNLLTGDQEFDSPKTLSAFALGLMLFIITLFFNLLAQRFVSRRPHYGGI